MNSGVAIRVSPWVHVLQAGSALAAGMGVGRFVFTPLLPLMVAQAGLTASDGAALATANYLGYLAGALAAIALPALARSRSALRGSLVMLAMSLAAMGLSEAVPVWFVLRLIAGVTSAFIFVAAVSALLSNLRHHASHMAGWGFGGVGAGIALSGAMVLILRSLSDWRMAWWASAGLVGALALASWTIRTETDRAEERPAEGHARDSLPKNRPAFLMLLLSYSLEGVGYIIAGTFLVAAIQQTSPGWLGGGAWALVGLAAVPSSAFWVWLGRRWSHPSILTVALTVQAIGIALPSLQDGVAAAIISAILFGATFIGISTIAVNIGTQLAVPRSIAVLTAGYSVGQILGPLIVLPVLHEGYRTALVIGAVVIVVAAAAAAALRQQIKAR